MTHTGLMMEYQDPEESQKTLETADTHDEIETCEIEISNNDEKL